MQSSFQNAINMKAEYLFLHQQDSFYDENIVAGMRGYPLHIYLICKSPIIHLDNAKTVISKDEIELTFYTSLLGNKKEFTIKTVNRRDQPIKSVQTDYPYTLIKAFGPDGSPHSVIKSNLLLRLLAAQQSAYFEEFNLEVLYTGQAFGEDGERITVDRLGSHEKAQKIYFDTMQKYPDYEIWFLSITFEPLLMTMFRPHTDIDEKSFNAQLQHQEHVEGNPVSFDQQITIMEATLIKYFNTKEYNKEYLDFPSKLHKSYNQCYELDLNSAGFEITTESIYAKLWSRHVPASFIHYKSYFLHANTERKDMFKWFEVS